MTGQELRVAMSRLSGYPIESRTVQAFVQVAQDYAATVAADALLNAADDYQIGLGAVAPEVPLSLTQFAPWLRSRADALSEEPA